MSCELICTGWYCSDEPRTYQTFGDDSIRNNSFRPLWWHSVDTFIKPQHVLVVDSASPLKPDDHLHTLTKYSNIELLNNPGHAQNCITHYAGCMAAMILGLDFALHNDVDFFLYVEQDALVYGKGFIEKIKQQLLKSDFVFGDGGKFAEIEQTVFAVNKKGIRKFLSALHDIHYSDRQIGPEVKFMYAASLLKSSGLASVLSYNQPRIMRRFYNKLFCMMMPIIKQYELLPFGYGRVRPINFADDIFYFQQGSIDEINTYKKLTGFNDMLSK
jgi:hypothetical protein